MQQVEARRRAALQRIASERVARPADGAALIRDHLRTDARRRQVQRQLRPHHLRGADLRFSLLTLLHQSGRPCAIPELHEQLTRRGLVVAGADLAKTISDVLRLEVAKRRVERVRRGWYRALPRPDTTTRRHRDRLADLEAAARRHPPPLP